VLSRIVLRPLAVAAAVAAMLAVVMLAGAAYAGEKPATDTAKPTQHIIYVPYEKLDKVFEAEDKGVFLPYSEFKELWEFYRRHHIAGPEIAPPVPVLISRAVYELAVEADVATGTATLSLESLDEEWVRLALPFDGIALSEATLDGEPVLLRAMQTGYELLLHKRGRQTLSLTFVTRVVSQPGRKSVRFNVPPAALSKVNVTIPDGDVKIDVDHLVSGQRATRDNKTTFSAFLGPTDTVGIGWQPKEVEREKIPPLLHARTATKIIVTEGLLRARASIHYDVMRAPAEQFAVLLPADFNLLDVSGQQIKSWDVADTARGKVLTVELHEPVEGSYSLVVEVERVLTTTDLTLEAPRIEATGDTVAREIGSLSFAAGPELRLTVETTSGLARMDLSELPDAHKVGPAALYAYRYWKPGWTATFAVEKILPRVEADVVALTTIDKRAVSLHADVAYTVSDAGIFQLAVTLPADLKVRTVGPDAIVESHSVSTQGELQTVEVLLKEKKLGAFTINIYADRTMPDEFADGDTVAIPEVTVLNVERETGMVGIAAHPSYEVSPTETHENLIKIAKQEFLARRSVSGGQEFRLAYRYAEHPYSATVTLAKRSPQVAVQVDTLVNVGEDATTIGYTLGFMIRYAGITELKFKIDPAAAEALQLDPSKLEHFRIEGPNIRDRKYLGDGVWQVTLDGEQTGGYALTVSAKIGTDLLHIKADAAPKVAIPTIEVKDTMGIFQETGHFAVWKSPDLDVKTTPSEGLEVRDAREMPAPLRSATFAKGFRYLKPMPGLGLKVGVIKYEHAAVVGAIVQDSHYDMVASLEGKLVVEAFYRIRNNTLQFFRIRLPEEAEIYGAFVSGAAVTPRMGTEGERLIKIPQLADQDFILRLTYETPMASGKMGVAGRLRFTTPEIVDMAVSRLSVRLFLPRRYTYLRFHGDIPRVDYCANPWEVLSDRFAGLISPPPLSGGYRLRQPASAFGDRFGVQRGGPRTGGDQAPEIPKDGLVFHFMKLGGAGEIRVTYWRSTWWAFWEIVAALFVIASGVAVCRYTRLRRGHYLIAALIVIIIFYSFSVAEAWVILFRWAFIGLVILALVWLVLAIVPSVRQRRAVRATTAAGSKKGGE
jgi:hypothetical protein